MRYLLREQPYERPLAAGTLAYDLEGGGPLALEHWRLTEALDGYRFFRLDLDERAAAGRSLLVHLLLNERQRVENIRFRLFSAAVRVEGQVIIEEEMVTVVRTVNETQFEYELAGLSADLAFFLPTAAGCALLRPWAGRGPAAGLLLNGRPGLASGTAEEWLAPRPVTVSCDLVPSAGLREQQMAISWRGAGDRPEAKRVTLTIRDPHTAVTGAIWESGLRAAARQTIHYRRSGR